MISLTEHPKNVCMTYIQHCKIALYFSWGFYMAGTKSLVHSIFPFLFITSTGDALKDIKKVYDTAGCH